MKRTRPRRIPKSRGLRAHELIRRGDRSLGPLPDSVYMGLVHGIREVVRDALEKSARPRLTKLAPDMVFWITATIRGAAAAGAELDAA